MSHARVAFIAERGTSSSSGFCASIDSDRQKSLHHSLSTAKKFAGIGNYSLPMSIFEKNTIIHNTIIYAIEKTLR